MFDKILAWCGNVLLASVLVLLASQQAVFAQSETEGTAATTIEEEGKIRVPLTGTATSKTISGLQIQPTSFDTGLVEIGDSAQQSIVIKHVGAADSDPISIESAELFGKNSSEYQSDFNGFVTLYPGEQTEFNVVFTPVVPGVKSAGQLMQITGSTAPYVLLFNGKSRYPLTSDLSVNTNKVNFGSVVTGGTINKNFILKNDGEADAPSITVSSVNLSGDTPASFDATFAPKTLAPGETMSVPVKLSDNNDGFKSADVTVNHDGNNNAVELVLEGNVVKPQSVAIEFGQSTLKNALVTRGTSIQFGPDGRLYVSEMNGLIKVFTINRNGKNNYTATAQETINVILNTPNHNDDGSVNGAVKDRLVTGIYVTGTAGTPIIYVASSDPRQAAGPSGTDANLDTNSGILHKLTKNGGGWNKQDLVRGLPRSEENHVSNGLLMHNNKILLNTGGHTNMGVKSNNFAELSEYALSGAILEIDINAINGTYDLPTLDDEDRPGVNDANDPFGGNDGKNQAKLMQNGPVKLYATGFRNIFDITKTESGKIYVFDNGPNPGWGGWPGANCVDAIDNGGAHHWDGLHLVTKGFYGGHPNPTRGNKNNKFNASNPQSPIEGNAMPGDCVYKQPGNGDGSLTTIISSTNGLDEYAASNFLGGMQGDLLVASFNKSIYRLQLNNAGTQVTSKSQLVTGLGSVPLDLTAQGDNDPFPGTIWVVDNLAETITVLEPSDF